MSTVLGADLSVKFYPLTGPLIRDHIQAAMVESFIGALDSRRWAASPEVPVYRPSRGVIDLVVGRREPLVIASEFNSELRRLEQQVRWHREKEESLPISRPVAVPRHGRGSGDVAAPRAALDAGHARAR